MVSSCKAFFPGPESFLWFLSASCPIFQHPLHKADAVLLRPRAVLPAQGLALPGSGGLSSASALRGFCWGLPSAPPAWDNSFWQPDAVL